MVDPAAEPPDLASCFGGLVLVTGGASLIGSHLVDVLVGRGERVRVVDDLSSGCRENLAGHLARGAVEWIEGDLREPAVARAAVDGARVVFHLAADHGGRGYVDTHRSGPASNLALDGLVLHEAAAAGVERYVYASSGCVYPLRLQTDPESERRLAEHQVGPPYEADNMYGWAKLAGEMALAAYCAERGLRGVSCRLFTCYGPRGVENHALVGMLARALARQDPFEVWGDGRQVRNWTYVEDTVRGLLLAARRIEDGSAVNIGAEWRHTVAEAARLVLELTGHSAPLRFLPDRPRGPLNRVADASLARGLLGWEPRVRLREGLQRTLDWYRAHRSPERVRELLPALLSERGVRTGPRG